MNKLSDEWETPDWLFDELDREFNFDIDLCATANNKKVGGYCVNYLVTDIAYIITDKRYKIGSAFMNPPYSNPKPFIEKAWEDSRYCLIVCLLPNTIKTCKYMDGLDENNGLTSFRKWRQGLEIRDLSRRTKFAHPEKVASSPSFGCMLLIMDRREL